MNSRFRSVLGVVAALFLLAAGNPIISSAQQGLAPADRQFLENSAKDGMMEVSLAELGTRKATSPEVKEFAGTMAQDHTAANKQLMELAQNEGVRLPADMGEEHRKMIDELGRLSGPEFNQAFMEHVVKHHKDDLKAFEREVQEGKDPDVKSFASKMLPKLEHHLSMAVSVNERISGQRRG